MPSVPDLLNRSPGYHQATLGRTYSPGIAPPLSPGYLNSPGGSQTSAGMEHSFPPPPSMFSPNSPYKKGKREKNYQHDWKDLWDLTLKSTWLCLFVVTLDKLVKRSTCDTMIVQYYTSILYCYGLQLSWFILKV